MTTIIYGARSGLVTTRRSFLLLHYSARQLGTGDFFFFLTNLVFVARQNVVDHQGRSAYVYLPVACNRRTK